VKPVFFPDEAVDVDAEGANAEMGAGGALDGVSATVGSSLRLAGARMRASSGAVASPWRR